MVSSFGLKVVGSLDFPGGPKTSSFQCRGCRFDHGQGTKGLPRWLSGREFTCQCKRHRRHVFDPWVGKIPWRREWLLTPIFLPGKSHGQRNRVGYGPWGGKESAQLKQLISSNSSRELRSQRCRQKQQQQQLGPLHAISPE